MTIEKKTLEYYDIRKKTLECYNISECLDYVESKVDRQFLTHLGFSQYAWVYVILKYNDIVNGYCGHLYWPEDGEFETEEEEFVIKALREHLPEDFFDSNILAEW